MEIIVSGICVDVLKKNIKNMHLSVLPPNGKVRISAPISIGDESITLFIRMKLGWIKKQQEKFINQPRQNKREYVSGETMYLFGKPLYLIVNYNNKCNSLTVDADKAILSVRKESTVEQRERFVNEWYRSKLKEQIHILLPKWEKITGLYSDSWQTKNMTTKWGTCNIASKKI